MSDPLDEVCLNHLAPYHVHEVEISKLKPHPRNFEIYQDRGIDPHFLASIQSVGKIITPLRVTTKGIVVCGNRRLQHAAYINEQSEGVWFKTVPCIVDFELRTEEQILLTLIQDNVHQRRDVTPEERWNELRIMNELMRAYACLRALNGGKEFSLEDAADFVDPENPRHVRHVAALEHMRQLGDGKVRELAEIYNKHNVEAGRTCLHMVAFSLGMSKRQADNWNQIQGAIAWYRDHGMADKAEELRKMFNSNDAREIRKAARMAKAAYTQYSRIKDPQRISKSPGSVDIKLKQITRMMSTMRLQLDYEGGVIAQRILDDLERLPAHVVHGNSTIAETLAKGKSLPGLEYMPKRFKDESAATCASQSAD